MTGTLRRLVLASAIAVVLTSAFLTGSGHGSAAAAARGGQRIPAGLAAAIHARFGPGAIRSSWAARVAEGPALGSSVSLSADGTTALVGAPNSGPLSSVFGICCHWRNGAAFIYHVSSAGSWSSTAIPTATLRPNSAATLFAGDHVALSPDGTTAFVGAESDGARGAVYVFHVPAENAWASSSKPQATLTSNSTYLGQLAVSSDGTTLVVNAPYSSSFGGTAHVFHVASEGAWATTHTPTATLTDAHGGRAVAISGDGMTVLLSNYKDVSGGFGAAVFHVSAENAWTSSSTPNAILSDSNVTGEYSGLGAALALSGDGTVALADTSLGTVDVFHTSAASAWASTTTPTATLSNAGGSEDDSFGDTVRLSTDGTTALVSAPGVKSWRGAAYVFHVASAGAWATSSAPTASLSDSSGHVDDGLGYGALSADGATALLGAPGANWATGKAALFHVADPSSWLTSSSATATLTNSALPKPFCVVPRLVGKSLFRVKETLYYTNCFLGWVKKVHSTKKNRRRVVWQSRAPKRHLPPGSKINIRMGR